MKKTCFLLVSIVTTTESFTTSATRNLGVETSSNLLASVADLEQKVDDALIKGLDPRPLIAELEDLPSISDPNRSSENLGTWHVWYTDCPPPSDGQLGPFQGTSGQVIDATGKYQNLLQVPPNNWLSATLDGKWEEWNGVCLDDRVPLSSQCEDWGSRHWKVTFLQLQISLLGLPIFTKKFDETQRIWRTTYLDENIRVVHAGTTGREKDEFVFYTKRMPAP